MEHAHISTSFDVELRDLKDQVLAMGALVEAHIAAATRALIERDPEGAARVVDRDRVVNRLELAIDEACIRLLALRQPAASDLRFIAAALKIVVDLERIGDLAANMAERIADHTTNVAEMVIYLVRGKDVRHTRAR